MDAGTFLHNLGVPIIKSVFYLFIYLFFYIFVMSACAMLTVQVRLSPPPVAHQWDCRCSCADGVGRVSLKCLSSERGDVVLKGAWPSRRARALAAAFDAVLQSDI